MRYEKHGDILRVLDKHGWTRFLVYWDQVSYIVVGPLGMDANVRQMSFRSKVAFRAYVRKLAKEHNFA